MTNAETPDFNGWSLDRLNAQRKHLWSLLVVSAGQGDPERPQLRAEHAAVCAACGPRMTAAPHVTTRPPRTSRTSRRETDECLRYTGQPTTAL